MFSSKFLSLFSGHDFVRIYISSRGIFNLMFSTSNKCTCTKLVHVGSEAGCCSVTVSVVVTAKRDSISLDSSLYLVL